MIPVHYIHTASIASETADYRLNYDGGSATFTVTKTLTGAGGAHGVVKSVTLITGAWGSGTAAGYVVLSGVVGTFVNDEVITDTSTPAGTAVANGTQTAEIDNYGAPSTTDTATSVPARFIDDSGSMIVLESGEHIVRAPKVRLPAGTTIAEGQKVTSTNTGFSTTYKVLKVRQVYQGMSIRYIECDLEAVT